MYDPLVDTAAAAIREGLLTHRASIEAAQAVAREIAEAKEQRANASGGAATAAVASPDDANGRGY